MDCMLDLETFSLRQDAAIVQLGYVAFDISKPPGEMGAPVSLVISLQSSILCGGYIDSETITWWRMQDSKAKAAISVAAVHLTRALEEFSSWYINNNIANIWAMPVTFDIPVFTNAYAAIALEPPWEYNTIRCGTTLCRTAELLGWQKPTYTTPTHIEHDAASDAKKQAFMVQHAYNFLASRGSAAG